MLILLLEDLQSSGSAGRRLLETRSELKAVEGTSRPIFDAEERRGQTAKSSPRYTEAPDEEL